jgi:hypothetical protein
MAGKDEAHLFFIDVARLTGLVFLQAEPRELSQFSRIVVDEIALVRLFSYVIKGKVVFEYEAVCCFFDRVLACQEESEGRISYRTFDALHGRFAKVGE